MTSIDVQVIAEEITIIPGPYYKFAGKYLGIESVPEKPRVPGISVKCN
jgi:hypothetical protein